MRGWTILLGTTLGLLAGCDDQTGTCAALGNVINVGDRVVDHEANVVCTCTKDGPICTPIPVEVGPDSGARLNDASVGSGGQGGAGGQALVDLGSGDQGAGGQGGADAGQTEADQGVVDAAVDQGPPDPADCPAERPRGRCGGLVGLRCSYGAEPFFCCAREYATEVRCACDADALWTCVDQRANCAASSAGRHCLRQEDVCAAWQRLVTEREADQDHQWDGDVATCDAGDMTPEWRAQALARLNDWRTLGDMPPVEVDAARNDMAQACALALKAGGQVTHHLEPDAPCFSPEAQAGAAGSNVMIGAGPIESYWHYMEDWGQVNFAGLPHRLWMLSNRLGPVGLGATDVSTCMHVANGGGHAARDYVKWPPAGVFPYDAHLADETGWSIQSDRMNMNDAFITVVRTDDNQDMPITQRRLEAEGGAAHGQAFAPDGWSPQPGDTFLVSMAGVRQPLEYEVRFVDCDVVRP